MNKNILKISGAITIFVVLDQFTKWMAGQYLQNPMEIINGFFQLKYSENTGIAMSVQVPYMLLIILNVILVGVIIYLAIKELDLGKLMSEISVALVLGGGVGNLIDRVLKGFVVDFISIWKYPIFNLADAFLAIGVLLIIIFYGRIRAIKSKNNG